MVIVSVALLFIFPVATEKMVEKKVGTLVHPALCIFDAGCKKNVSPKNVVSIGSRNPENGPANKKI